MKSNLLVHTILMVLLLTVGVIFNSVSAEEMLPERTGARPQTTPGVPHVQIGVSSVPEVDNELLRRVSTLPGLEIRPTVVSLPGAKGFWLNERVQLAHPPRWHPNAPVMP